MTEALRAEVVELTLSEDFAGRPRRGWPGTSRASTEVDRRTASPPLAPWLAAGPLLVPTPDPRPRPAAGAAQRRPPGRRGDAAARRRRESSARCSWATGSATCETFSAQRPARAAGTRQPPQRDPAQRPARRPDPRARRGPGPPLAARRAHRAAQPPPARAACWPSCMPTGRRPRAILLDLDRFKEINDTLGHQTGDALLRDGRPTGCAGSVPADAMVARLGGDEFAVLLATRDDAGDRVGGGAASDMRSPCRSSSTSCMVTVEASVGVAAPGARRDAAATCSGTPTSRCTPPRTRRTGVETYRRRARGGTARSG